MERREHRESDPAEAADRADTPGLQSRAGCRDTDNKTSAATESNSPLACFPPASAAQLRSGRPSESHRAEQCGPRRGAGSGVGTGDHCKPRSLPRPGSAAPRSPVTLPSQAVRASAPQAHYRETPGSRAAPARGSQLRSPRARARAHPLPGPAPHLIHLSGAPSPRGVPPPPPAWHVSRAQPPSRGERPASPGSRQNACARLFSPPPAHALRQPPLLP